MPSTLTKLLRNTLPDPMQRLSETVNRLHRENAHAQATLAAAEERHADALVDAAEAGSPRGDLPELKRALDEARTRAADAAAALQRGQERLLASRRDEHLNAAEALKKQRVAKAEERQRAVEELQAASEQYASAVHRVKQLTSELDALAPTGMLSYDKTAPILRSDDLDERIRMELVRLGVAWALAWPWPPSDIPPITKRFEGVVDAVRAWK